MQTWETLKQNCQKCQECELCATRTNVVFGAGNPNAEVLFIGEAPGANEDAQGLPFVGRGGKLLDSYLASINLSRDKNIFISNIVKCRPPENRDPRTKEREACRPWLEEQLNIMQPKIIVCLGRIAAQLLIRKGYIITKEHGQWTKKNGIWYTATLHPAALLRNPRQKPLAEEDYAALRKKMAEVCINT